jgi:hypothetical protein
VALNKKKEQPFLGCLRAMVKTEGGNLHKDINDKGLVHEGNSVSTYSKSETLLQIDLRSIVHESHNPV